MTLRPLTPLAVTAAVLLAAASGLIGRAETPALPSASIPDPSSDTGIKDQAALKTMMLGKQFKDLENTLLRMAQFLEKSKDQKDRDKAALLRKAIEVASKEGVDNQFSKLVSILQKENKDGKLTTYDEAKDQNAAISKSLQEILDILTTNDESARIKAERIRIEKILEKLDGLIRDEKLIRAQADANKTTGKKLADNQGNVTKSTEDLAKAIAGKDPTKEGKEGKPGDKGGENKPSENKGEKKEGGEKKADGKDDTGEGKGDKKGGEGKGGDPKDPKDPKSDKDGKGGEGKGGDPKDGKDGEKKGGEAKGGEGKDGKDKDNKGGEGKGGPGKDPMKPTDPKDPMAGKGGEGKEGKPSDGKGKGEGKGEGKPSDGKGGEGKGGEGKPSDGKGGDGKGGEGKGGESKGGGGQPPPGGGGDKPPQGGGDKPPQGGGDKPGDQIGKKQIEDAIEKQKQAEEDLRKEAKENGSEKITEAIKELEKARKELEKKLKQLREEEQERLLTNLQQRCERMLALQLEVYDGTKKTHAVVQSRPEKKPGNAEQIDINKLADKESEIVKEAERGLRLLEEEGTAVAFAEGFRNILTDTSTIQTRLEPGADVGTFTQGIEADVIATLKEMIEALKKAKENLKQPPPPGGGGGGGGGQANQKLLEMINELKMIRSMQLRINTRTKAYADEYTGEQADDPKIQKELKDLGLRQDKLEDVTRNIATGKNK